MENIKLDQHDEQLKNANERLANLEGFGDDRKSR
jgi:hypothetical protein